MAPPVTDDSSERKRIPICVDVIEYAPSRGLISDWDDETVLRVETLDSPPNTVLISGNRAGLTSLARHLLTLTQAKAQRGAHLDLDDYSGWFEEGSAGVRIELE
jgi:hypothetical protein